jgi:hypothetical protein
VGVRRAGRAGRAGGRGGGGGGPYRCEAMKAFVAAIRDMLFVVHGGVMRFQSLPHKAPTTVAPHQQVIAIFRAFLSQRALEPGLLLIDVQMREGAVVMQGYPARNLACGQ